MHVNILLLKQVLMIVKRRAEINKFQKSHLSYSILATIISQKNQFILKKRSCSLCLIIKKMEGII